MNRSYYLQKLTEYPPHINAYKILRKVFVKLKVEAESLKATLFSTYISDKQFLESLFGCESIGELLKHIRERKQPNFFLQLSDRSRMVEIVKSHYPNIIEQTIADSDKICEHIFNLLGSGNVHLGEKFDWHTDFKIGWRWKLGYHKKIECRKLNKPYDLKVPWELSRCQHFVTLGKAYWYTGNDKYAKEFVAQVNDWIDSNPPKFGINWVCAMDVAIRAVNWIWGYYFFKDSPILTDEFLLKFLKSILAHGRHIMNNLENKGKIISNHYLSNLVGLVYLATMFPEFKEAKRWQEFGVQELISEMGKQVYPDGVDYEASISYHRLVTELFLSATILCLKNADIFNAPSQDSVQIIESAKYQNVDLFPDWYMKWLEKMIEFVMYYTKPDGTAPQIGDNDDGRLHILSNYGSWNRLDHRYLLSVGAVLFNRPDFKKAAGEFHEEAFWLLGKKGLKFNAIPETEESLSSRAFPDAGIYIMRKDDLYMIIDCGANGQNGNGGHAHNDTLSFELYAGDKTFIVDPGTYVYTSDYKMRNLFRSTAYHNTIVVNEQEQNRFDMHNPFKLYNDATPKINRWESTDAYDFLDAEHNGYERLSNPIIHRRRILFNKVEGYWIIDDFLFGISKYEVTAKASPSLVDSKSKTNFDFDMHLHFSPIDIRLYCEEHLDIYTNCSGVNILVLPLDTNFLQMHIEDGWISYGYGSKMKSPILKYSKRCDIPVHFTTLLYPYQNAEIIASCENLRENAFAFMESTNLWSKI